MRTLLTGRQTFFVTFWVVYLPIELVCGLIAELVGGFGRSLPDALSSAILLVAVITAMLNAYVMGVAVIWCAVRNRPLDNWQWFGSFGAAAGMLLPIGLLLTVL